MNPLADSILAGLGLLVCVALLLRYALPPARRQRLDDGLRRLWQGVQARAGALGRRRQRPQGQARPMVDARSAERQARREADDLINRARRKARDTPAADRDGNVIRPDAFKSRPPRDRLH